MNKTEAGRLGGITTSVKYGPERCLACGHLPVKSEFHVRNGQKGGYKGGKKTLLLHGHNHFPRLDDWEAGLREIDNGHSNSNIKN
jgi:calcineurin-like phosphoesterase family protein